MNEQLYEKITNALVHNGYIIIEKSLQSKLSNSLYTLAKDESSYHQSGISNKTNLHINTSKRSDKTKWIDEDGGTQSEYLAFMQGLQSYLNRSLYLGIFFYESHFALYEKGDFYEKHLDSFKGSKNRIVTTVYYLNEDWNEEDAGELIIYDKNNNILQTVKPKNNTLVIFMSEDFPHEVLKANKKRYSIAGWFRVDR
jgi:SM-20-related protein